MFYIISVPGASSNNYITTDVPDTQDIKGTVLASLLLFAQSYTRRGARIPRAPLGYTLNTHTHPLVNLRNRRRNIVISTFVTLLINDLLRVCADRIGSNVLHGFGWFCIQYETVDKNILSFNC